MSVLTAIWMFLKGVPLWVWAVLALLVGGWYYGNARFNAGDATGAARVTHAWDAQKARDKAASEKLDREFRAREKAEQLAAVESRRAYDKRIADGIQEAATLRADLVAARRRVRDIWRPSVCDVPNDHPADPGGESQANLQAASVERIDRALAAGEAQIILLQERYMQAEKVCGTTQPVR